MAPPPPPVLPGYFLHEKSLVMSLGLCMHACASCCIHIHASNINEWKPRVLPQNMCIIKKVFTHECHMPEHQIVNNSVKGRGETPLRRLYHRRVGMPGIQQLWFNISIWRWLQWRTKWTGALSKVELGENSQAGAWSSKPLCAYTHM